jgi:hypothetical protein
MSDDTRAPVQRLKRRPEQRAMTKSPTCLPSHRARHAQIAADTTCVTLKLVCIHTSRSPGSHSGSIIGWSASASSSNREHHDRTPSGHPCRARARPFGDPHSYARALAVSEYSSSEIVRSQFVR